MDVKLVDDILNMYNQEIERLGEAMTIARVSGDNTEYIKLSERHDELILLFHGTINIINKS